MAKLTTQEKAARYDALQVAIDFTIDTYKRRYNDAEKKYTDATVIGAYNKGMADAYKEIVKTLRGFKNNDSCIEVELKEQQLQYMTAYKNVLELRAAIDKIDL